MKKHYLIAFTAIVMVVALLFSACGVQVTTTEQPVEKMRRLTPPPNPTSFVLA